MSSFYGGSRGGLSSEDLEAITSKIFKFEIVNALPENNISDSTIYLISTGEQEDNIYTEYVYINNHWEKFGTQKIDLTNYVTLEFFDEKLAAKQDNLTAGSNISITEVDGKFIISAVDTTYSNATPQTSGLMSSTDKTKIDGITAEKIQAWDAAEQNIQPDWLQNDNTADDYIKNKPNFALVADVNNALAGKVDKETNKSLMSADEHTKLTGIESGAQVNTVTGVKGSNEAEYRTGNVSITKGNVGLGNVDNTADTDKPISTAAQTALDGKVDKITGKGLSEANFTDAEKTKLAGIATGAEVNVQSDWNQGNDAADDYIKNKPSNLVQDASYVHTDNNFTNAEKAKADGAIQSTEKGTANGVAELDANGKVPTSQLPAYVDDVLSYNSLSDFPATGEDGKIYIAKDTNLSYRWTGSEYGVISPSLALGNTSSTAYRGDRGASAYTHAVTNKGSAFVSGLYKITTNSEGHVTAATSVTKSDITGLGIPAQDTNTDTKVTSAANHYAPAEDASAVLSADASGSTAATWNNTSLVTGVDIKRDAKGHVVGVAVDSVKMPANPNTNTTYSAGTGLSLSGTTFNHSNSVTAGTAQGDASKTLTFGGTFTVPTITYDAQGHITAKGSTTMTMPANPNTNNAVAQTATTTSADYEVLFSATADNTTRTEGARKNSNLKFNPSTGNLRVTKINGVEVGNAPKFTDNNTTYSAGTGLSLSGTTFSNAAPNVKSDWNAAAGTDAEILNKPTIPNYSNATASAAGLMSAADKTKLGGIESGAEANVQSDWNQSDTTADDFIKNKPDLSVYAPATFDDVGSGNMTYNNMVLNGTTYPNTVTLQKNANNYRLLLVRYYVTRLGGVQLWDYKVIPAPNVAAQSLLLKAFDLSGGTLTEYIFGLQFSANGTTITLTYGVNDISLSIRIWGIK